MKLDEEEIGQRVRKSIGLQLGISGEDISLSDHIINDLHADSLDVVEIVMLVEEEFEFAIPDGDAEGLDTVGDIVNYVCRRMNA